MALEVCASTPHYVCVYNLHIGAVSAGDMLRPLFHGMPSLRLLIKQMGGLYVTRHTL